MLSECYDIGGTKIIGALVEDGMHAPRILKSIKQPTDSSSTKALVAQIKKMSNELRAGKKPEGVSVCVPGPVKDGVLLGAAPLGWKQHWPAVHELTEVFKTVVRVDNDLNVAIEAERILGAGKITKNFYLLTLSTGIGAGIVLDGKVVGGLAGEFGHDVQVTNGEPAACGHLGCWEAYSSGNGLSRAATKVFGKPTTAEELFQLAEKGDAKAKELVERARLHNAQGIGSMANALPMDKVVIMGSIGLNQFIKVIPTREEVSKFAYVPVPQIERTSLGENIGILGCHLALE
ncbi:MAG TPA: ROK family protein [Candidatus Norongarragalinales archaeon]|jgi:glucokinase|nr:ROK family protein [Candidatus Norongarragalinales archaeon]